MDLSWDLMRTVMLVTRHGTLAGAAAVLGLTYTTVARRIDKAEADLGVPLFERFADGYRPTEAARLIAEHAAQMETITHTLARHHAGADQTLRGPLVVTAPQLLIAHVLGPVIDQFTRAHPEVALHLRASNDLLDLSRRAADLAIRVSMSPGDALKGLRLTPQHSGFFAAPALAQSMDEHPGSPHPWLIFDQHTTLPRQVLDHFPTARIRARFDDMAAMAGAAQAGLGAVRMPLFLGRSLPGLVPVPRLVPVPYLDIWAVAHEDVWPSAKVQAFHAILKPWVQSHRSLFTAADHETPCI